MPTQHTIEELKQLQALPLSAKIIRSKALIRTWYEHFEGMVYVGFSGGKDSTVLKHLVDSLYNDVPSVFVNTGLEYPEIQKFVRECRDGLYEDRGLNSNVEIIRPEMRFDEVLTKYGYPVIGKEIANAVDGAKKYEAKLMFEEDVSNRPYNAVQGNNVPYRYLMLKGLLKDNDGSKSAFNKEKWEFLIDSPFAVSDKCCDVMKKKPSKQYEKETKRLPILGQLATESRKRKMGWAKTGCNAFEGAKRQSNPLAFWTENDVLEYLIRFDIPYCSAYGFVGWDGEMVDAETPKYVLTREQRTGCMFCMFGIFRESEPNRFQKMRTDHPNQYDFCMKPISEGGLGLKDVIDWVNENSNLKKKIEY